MGASRLASSRRLASVSRPATPDSRDRVVVMSVHRARATTPSFPTHSSILRGGRARGVDAKRASPNTRALEHTSTFADAVAGVPPREVPSLPPLLRLSGLEAFALVQ